MPQVPQITGRCAGSSSARSTGGAEGGARVLLLYLFYYHYFLPVPGQARTPPRAQGRGSA